MSIDAGISPGKYARGAEAAWKFFVFKGVPTMEYAVLMHDFGQGEQFVAVPVSQRTGDKEPDYRRPYSAFEVLTDFFGEDMSLVLGNFVQMESEKIRSRKEMEKAQKVRLLAYQYQMTKSMINQPIDHTVVDFMLRGLVEGEVDGQAPVISGMDFRVRYILDLRPCEQKCAGPLVFLEDDMEKDSFWNEICVADGVRMPANEYLLPILYAKDYEKVAHEILRIFYPEYRSRIENGEGFVINGDDLAMRMGLPVIDVHFANPDTMGQIYYNPGPVSLLDENGNEYQENVEAGTILVSIDRCGNPAIRNSTICHECCHMYLDRSFFFLQMMTGRRYASYVSRRSGAERARYKKNGPVSWMELQCEKLPAYLLLESGSTRALVESELAKSHDAHSPEAMRGAISTVAQTNNVSFSMAKYRMIELGYQEAEGIRDYVDGSFIPDHGCSGRWPKNVTYTISASNAAALAENNPEFLNLISSGRYRYVEGHFCLNLESFLRESWTGTPYLTNYARTHIDECCLAFEVHGRYNDDRYRLGRASRRKTTPNTSQYRPGYSLAAEPGTAQYVAENKTFYHDSFLWGDFLYDMPANFGEAVNEILRKKGITKENLAEELGIDRRTLTSYFNQLSPSISHVVGICVALKLPFFISAKLIELSGNSLQNNRVHHLYREFLLQAEKLSVARCEDILSENGCPPLFRGQNMSDS